MRALFLAVLLGCAGPGAEWPGTGGSGQPRCGSERWAVKTATDGAMLREDRPLKRTTVEQLSALSAPRWREAMPRQPAESEVVELVVYLRASKFEDEDGDYHLLISDAADGPTMIVEAPDPSCAAGSPYREGMERVRRSAVQLLGLPGPRLREVSPPKRARVVGVPFWDKRHGQSGMAPNGIELHPLLALEPLTDER